MAKIKLFVGTKTPMQRLITAPLALENIATMERRNGYSVLPYTNSGLMNSVVTINFFPSKLKYVQ